MSSEQLLNYYKESVARVAGWAAIIAEETAGRIMVVVAKHVY
jgi:hypothetical protein